MELQSTPDKPSRKPLTVKTQVMALHLQGLTNLQIASKLGMSKNTVGTIIAEGSTAALDKNSIEKTFAKVGITPETIAIKFKELQEAKDTRLASFEGKFTDRIDLPDGTVQFRATEAVAKILNLFPKEDMGASAQLFVRLPDIQLVKGHDSTCLCPQCRTAWEAIPVPNNNPSLEE